MLYLMVCQTCHNWKHLDFNCMCIYAYIKYKINVYTSLAPRIQVNGMLQYVVAMRGVSNFESIHFFEIEGLMPKFGTLLPTTGLLCPILILRRTVFITQHTNHHWFFSLRDERIASLYFMDNIQIVKKTPSPATHTIPIHTRITSCFLLRSILCCWIYAS